jgi:uncharacterized protein
VGVNAAAPRGDRAATHVLPDGAGGERAGAGGERARAGGERGTRKTVRCGGMWIPADKEILVLHEKHAPTPDALDLVYTHCVIVCAIAEQLCSRLGPGLGVDIDLVRAGSLLHDIGVYRLYDDAGDLDHANYIRHGVLGYELLREEGLPVAICRFASHHTGVGISRDDVVAQQLPIPPADYLAGPGEERLVMYADKFHSKTTPPVFRTALACAARLRRFGEEKVASFQAMRDTFGDPDLAALSETYGHPVVGEA